MEPRESTRPDHDQVPFYSWVTNLHTTIGLRSNVSGIIEYFEDKVADGHEIEYLVLVTSQFDFNRLSVFGFLKQSAETPEPAVPEEGGEFEEDR